MTRRPTTEKIATHDMIVRHAASLFLEHGTWVGIADVMSEAGLTHGGFYRHFKNKDDLIIEAVTLALQSLSERLVRAAHRAKPGHELEAIIATYLSNEHLSHPESWCALAALAGELARLPSRARKSLDKALTDYVERLAPFMPGSVIDERRQNFMVLMSGMTGAIAMIRLLGEKSTREAALSSIRDYYLTITREDTE